MSESLIFDLSHPGRETPYLPECDVPTRPPEELLPGVALRKGPAGLPSVAEVDVMRHFVKLSTKNHHVERGFYPLGSCTMKYNPKVNEWAASLPQFAGMHPFAPSSVSQGNLKLMDELGKMLCEIVGFDDITLQPAAGAHGELTGLLTIRAFHADHGNPRQTVVFPDSAHGTNPASVVIAGYKPVQIKSRANGLVDLDELAKVLDTNVAAFMLTNPNTLGIFERDIAKIAEMVHAVGAKMYMDGANLNALLGIVRPGDMGFDCCHINLHKTFSTPHGGGGPGSGPVAVTSELAPYLPIPRIVHRGDRFIMDYDYPKSIGRVHSFYGNFAILVRAYTYIRSLGGSGLRDVADNAVLNANYLLSKLRDTFDLAYPATPMHEFVLSGERQKKEYGVSTLDMAKRLLDYGFHAPTVYFPLIVHEAMMIEPTETESKDTLDIFADALIKIAEEAKTDPETLHQAPKTTPVGRLNEVKAARELNLCCVWSPEDAE